MRIVAKIVGSGTHADPYRVDLPTWQMIREITPRNKDGTFPPGAQVEVEVPDDECDLKLNKLDKDKIRRKYAAQPKWDRDDVAENVEVVT